MKELRRICRELGKVDGLQRGQNVPKQFKCLSTSSGGIDLSGIYPPITTPFNQSGLVDYDKLGDNMAKWNSIEFAGYVVMGSNGEAVSLRTDEKLELIRNVKKMSNSKSKIIGGLGLSTTQETIEICNLVASEKTADAALIVSPNFYKGQMTEKVLRKFYEDVADKSALPIIVYSVPANTSLDLSASLVTALADHPNIIGLKDSGGDITKISEIVHKTPANFQVLAGSAGFLLPSLLMGCVGGVCALANVLGEQVVQLYKLFEKKELDVAVSLQKTLISPNMWVTRKLGVPGLKASMDLKGFYGGPCRLPLTPLSNEEQRQLIQIFERDGYPLK